MKKPMSKTTHFSLLVVLGVLLLGTSVFAAELADDSYTLLIQQSPVDAGTVTPGSGVHKIQIGETISLSAIPKPGYRFLYWLGDVSASDAMSTTIQIDSPKLVVAVFSPEAYEEELPGVSLIRGASFGGGGGGRLIGTPISSPAGISPGGYYDAADFIYIDNSTTIYNNDDDSTDDDDIPVPNNDDDDIPVPGEDSNEVPEPATVLLLGLGAVALLRSKKE